MDVRVRRHDTSRVAPYEFRDTAELFARRYGGHGDIVWVAAPVNCWQVRFTLKPGDPRLRHPDDGTHYEAVLLHEFVDPAREPTHPKLDQLPRDSRNRYKPAFVAIELDELGTSGLQEILEKGRFSPVGVSLPRRKKPPRPSWIATETSENAHGKNCATPHATER